jgi:hypothetical protein
VRHCPNLTGCRTSGRRLLREGALMLPPSFPTSTKRFELRVLPFDHPQHTVFNPVKRPTAHGEGRNDLFNLYWCG